MTMTPAEVERKVRQLDNDVESIYGLLNRISITQQRHGNRVGELTEMVAAHDARFDSMDLRLDSMDGRLDSMDGRLDSMDGRLDSMDGRFDAMGGRLGRIETGLESVLTILRGQPSTD